MDGSSWLLMREWEKILSVKDDLQVVSGVAHSLRVVYMVCFFFSFYDLQCLSGSMK